MMFFDWLSNYRYKRDNCHLVVDFDEGEIKTALAEYLNRRTALAAPEVLPEHIILDTVQTIIDDTRGGVDVWVPKACARIPIEFDGEAGGQE